MTKAKETEAMMKDRSEKYLEDYADVFSDIANTLIFGEKLVRLEQLLPSPTESIYKAEDGLSMREQRRDTSKYVKELHTIISLIGFENQTCEDEDMSIRMMGYDYGSYRGQISAGRERYGVISAVLYFEKKPWTGGNTLKERLHIPEKFQEYVNDYRFHLIDVPRITKEQREELTSDFRVVADFFANRDYADYVPSNQELKHAEAVLNLLKTFAGDKRYTEIEQDIREVVRRGGKVTMCEFAERMEQKGIQKGIQEGIQEGIQKKLLEQIQKKLEKGQSVEEIAEALEEKPEAIQQLIQKLENK